jgi:RES domain-containing protein
MPQKALEVWRITSAKHAERAFDGEGARLYGGRWNHPGVQVVYTSRTLSLCALEYFVHLEPALAPKDLVAIRAEIPAGLSVSSLALLDLPSDWRAYPAPDVLKDLGAAWVRAGNTLALSVPSALIPHEQNVLLNPAHPDFPHVLIDPATPFSFDPRMWKR